MDKHILFNNKITDDKPSYQLFPKQIGHTEVLKIKSSKDLTGPNIEQMKLQRKYRLGAANYNNWVGEGG